MIINKIHWLGVGLSSPPGILYLNDHRYDLLVWNRSVDKAKTLLKNKINVNELDISNFSKKLDKNGPISTTHTKHIVQNSGKSIHETSYREPLITSLDGNTVELAVEQMQFAENSMRYTTTVNFLNGKINKIISAIKGE